MNFKVGKAALFVVGVLLVGCSEQSTTAPRLSPTSADVAFERGGNDHGVAQAVMGHAEFVDPNTSLHWAYAVHTEKRRDGAVDGKVAFVLDFAGGIFVKGDVICFGVVGNRANLAMRTTESNTTDAPPGQYFIWSLIDNGKGATPGDSPGKSGKVPDQSSTFQSMPNEVLARAHCAVATQVRDIVPVRGDLDIQPDVARN